MMKKMNDYWGWNDGGDGVFSYLYSLYEDMTEGTIPEWLENDSVTPSILDFTYHDVHSAERLPSPVVERYAKMNETEKLTVEQIELLVGIIDGMFSKNWNRLWAINVVEYNPIENYSMTEEDEPDITKTHSGSTTHSVSDDFKQNEKVTLESDVLVSGNTESDGYTYGFNNATPVPSDAGDSETNQRTTADPEHNITEKETTQVGTTEDADDYTDTETGTRTITRTGNIGVITSQQMAQSEIELWKWKFYESIMRDVDSLLTLSIYEYNKYER